MWRRKSLRRSTTTASCNRKYPDSGIKTIVIQKTTDVLGFVPHNLRKYLDMLEVKYDMNILQNSVLLGTANILRQFLCTKGLIDSDGGDVEMRRKSEVLLESFLTLHGAPKTSIEHVYCVTQKIIIIIN